MVTKVKLSMPEDATPADGRRAQMLRYFFMQQKEQLTRVRGNYDEIRIPTIYDRPTKNPCVWYQMAKFARHKYNPMWAMHLEFTKAMFRNGQVNPQTLCSGGEDKIQHWVEHGEKLAKDAKASAVATVRQITETIPFRMQAHDVSEKTAMAHIEETISVDPVLYLLWSDDRKMPNSLPRLLAARLAFAFCPQLYKAMPGLPQEWVERRKLTEVFEVNNGSVSAVPETTIDGVLTSK